jgi:hypothetical protein
VPMMEEWTGEAGIQVLDGWSFQASPPHLLFIHTNTLWAVPFRVRRVCDVRLFANIPRRAHVYFKSPQMHGETTTATEFPSH